MSVPNSESSKSRPLMAREYSLTMAMAKELSMLERHAQSKRARRNYIALQYGTQAALTFAQEKVVTDAGPLDFEMEHKRPAVLRPEGEHRPEPPAPVCALVVAGEPECDDLAALFLPVTAGEEEPWVDARRLHEALGVGKRFTSWIAGRVEAPGFVEGTDYIESEGLSLPTPGSSKSRSQKTKEYSLTMDMAKHLALLERNDQGKRCRDYLIACAKELQRRQRAELVPAIELKQSKDGSMFIVQLLADAAGKTVAAEAALKEATDRATKAEQALGDAVIQPGLAATVAAMGINLETEKLRANHWEAAARDQVFALQAWQSRAKTWEAEALALKDQMTTMVPRLIPTDTMSMTGFVNAYPELGLGRNQLTTFLRARSVLYTGPHKNGGIEGQIESLLITSHIDSGNCGCKPTERGFTNADAEPYTKQFLGPAVTPKGLPWLLKEIETYGFRWCIAR